MIEYRDAPELHALAGLIIERDRPELIGYPIRLVWRTPARKAGHNRLAAGTAELVKGRFAHFVMTDEEKAMEGQEDGSRMFWIEIAADLWEDLTNAQRIALVDHEICHLHVGETDDGEYEMVIREHDVEEFDEVVRRHGLWTDDLWQLGLTMAGLAEPSEPA